MTQTGKVSERNGRDFVSHFQYMCRIGAKNATAGGPFMAVVCLTCDRRDSMVYASASDERGRSASVHVHVRTCHAMRSVPIPCAQIAELGPHGRLDFNASYSVK